ncbi:hypothetical protein BGZ70_007234 [Mortierella alpina]|uniref:NAD(P)-binding domain-containing protein n=1 Tax=Mortierella alpina TaxID=64518 RepID=A0A9P6M312_MORAP|nr:hypothetical protein BGZ70_007234 [Mortierella alpina]
MFSKSTASTTEKRVAITNVDSWLGYCSAYGLAQELEKKCQEVTLVCLACNTDRLDKLKGLKNVHIVKVDYNDTNQLEKALQGVSCTILIPELDERRAEFGKNVLDAMNKQGVKSCMMISCDGASEDCDLKSIESFCRLEKQVEQSCSSCYLILRKGFLNQCFFFWSYAVKEKAEFPLTIEKDNKMAPLDTHDLVGAITSIVVKKCQDTDHGPGFGSHKNKTYTLTGPNELTPEHFVRELSDAIGKEVKLRHVERDELKKYLESLMHRPVLPMRISEDAPMAAGGGGHNHDDHEYFPINEAMIELLLDELEMIKRGKAGFASNDLEKILGHQGKSVRDFLRKEKDAFKPNHV